MNYDDFKNTIVGKYKVHLEESVPGNQFIDRQLHISDPFEGGQRLGFVVGFNRDGQLSFLAVDGTRMGRFNIAEGYTSDDILKVAQNILEGGLVIEPSRILRKQRLIFNTSQGKLFIRLNKNIDEKPYEKC
ncbi:MAG TPA: hypothetical protein VGO07_03005 [Candidatus Saccharimonadales bacterium]|jgi:hypothetical protein|nr:hypothetical protein [Candidatus Saccharimonadales bacterium]